MVLPLLDFARFCQARLPLLTPESAAHEYDKKHTYLLMSKMKEIGRYL